VKEVDFFTTTVLLAEPFPLTVPLWKLKSPAILAELCTLTVPSAKVKVPKEPLVNVKVPEESSKEPVVILVTEKLGLPEKDPVPVTVGVTKLTPERETCPLLRKEETLKILLFNVHLEVCATEKDPLPITGTPEIAPVEEEMNAPLITTLGSIVEDPSTIWKSDFWFSVALEAISKTAPAARVN